MKTKIKNSGFTLVEIMVAISISGILLFAMTKILLETRSLVKVQSNLEKIQNDSSFAFETIAQKGRSAGFRGCASSSNFIPQVKAVNIISQYTTKLNPIEGNKGNGTSFSPALDSSVSAFIPAPNPNFDVLTIRSAVDSMATVGDNLANPSSTKWPVNSIKGFAVDDIGIISNCSAAAIFNINSTANTTINAQSPSGVGYFFPARSQIYKYTTSSYYVATVNGENILYYNDNKGVSEPIINNVEKFSILYGVDINNTLNASQYLYINDVLDLKQIVSMRIGLVLKSADKNISVQTADKNKYTFLGVEYSPNDKNLRKSFYTTINVRNMLP